MKYYLLVSSLFLIVSCGQNSGSTKTTTEDSTKIANTPPATDTVKSPPLQPQNKYLITTTSFGTIRDTTSYSTLEKEFGKINLKDEVSYGAEGMDSSIVTKIFAGKPEEVAIYWKEKKFHKKIASVETTMEGSLYFTADSIMIGTTLDKLLSANGKKINFYGTGWDYGGTITSYNNGKFDKSPIFFQLADKPGMSQKLMGDQELNTDMPVVKANLNKVGISKISLSFNE